MCLRSKLSFWGIKMATPWLPHVLMKKIDIVKIAKKADLDLFGAEGLAKSLFPGHKFPVKALKRVISGRSLLDEGQVQRLASLSGFTITQIYEGVFDWKHKTSPSGIKLVSDEFTAELDWKTGITKVYSLDSLLFEEVLHTGLTTLDNYIQKLNTLVIKHKNK